MRLSPSIAILRTQSDERLVALARGGSENAFQAIAERYRRPLHGACRRVLSDSRAEDAVQQAFMSAWVALRRGDDVLNLRAWLLMIARNTALNALRAPGYDFSELRESLVTGPAPQDELERREVMRQTLAGLAALPERQREALLRSAVEGVAYADIARDLGLSEGATRQLVLRARTTMRSAATALVPWPLAHWVAVSGPTGTTLRSAEIAGASGGAGASALLAKAGIVAVMAGGVAAGPAVVRHERDAVPRAEAAQRTAAQQAPAPAAISAPQSIVVKTAAAMRRSDAPVGGSRKAERADDTTSAGRDDRESGRGSSGRGSDDDRGGSGSDTSGSSDHPGSSDDAGSSGTSGRRGATDDDSGHRGGLPADAGNTAEDAPEPARPEPPDDSPHAEKSGSGPGSGGGVVLPTPPAADE